MNLPIFTLIKTLRNLFFKIPLLAVWNITDFCNQNCLYCNAHTNNGNRDVSEKEATVIVQKIKKMGIKYVYVQGGEPLLHEKLENIISIIINSGLKPTVLTNGILLTKDF